MEPLFDMPSTPKLLKLDLGRALGSCRRSGLAKSMAQKAEAAHDQGAFTNECSSIVLEAMFLNQSSGTDYRAGVKGPMLVWF